MIDLRQPSKYTPEQIEQLKKNAADAIKRSTDMFKILQRKVTK